MSAPTPRISACGTIAARPADRVRAELPHPIVFRGTISAVPDVAQAHCSAPPLQASFRLPRLSRDAEAVTRPRTPLRATKQEDVSEAGAVAEFHLDVADEAKVKVEAGEPVRVEVDPRQLCTRLAAVWIAPRAPAAVMPRGPGRPKGSKSKPRVQQRFNVSAPPDREEAKKARARMTTRK